MPKQTFENLDPSKKPQMARTLKWMIVDKLAGRRRKSPKKADIPVVTPEIPPLAQNSVMWLGHSSSMIQLGGKRILTDPVFAHRLGGFIHRNIPVVLAAQGLPALDMIAISHNHRDHLDKPSILALEEAFQPRYVVPLGVDRYLKAWKIPAERITTLGWWDEAAPFDDSDLKVSLVPAQHWSQRTPFDRNTSLWGGFVFEDDGQKVYFAGDSGYFDGFKEIGKRFPGIDMALIPIGAYDPEWFMHPQHMNPEEAGKTFLDLGAARMVSIHWGTYKLTDEPLDEPPARLDDWRIQERIEEERMLTLPAGGSVLVKG